MSAAASTGLSEQTGAGESRERGLLRFITCGSVDDGKSTLIGRLLYDSRQLPDDQLSTLVRDSLRSGGQGDGLDLALAVDGLAAEREQGITIDVAYRYFSTGRRSFIVADTPGHEQYTRNMATGASTADAAVLLVDARKGLLRQTRRHSLIVSTLGVSHAILAVNKMDLVGWSQDIFSTIAGEYRDFARQLGFEEIAAVPISAKLGDNVARPSSEMPWYAGPDLLTVLETLDVARSEPSGGFRLPVQWVNRPHGDFRGYAGQVTGGAVRAGDRVVVLPSGERTEIARIVTYDGDLASAAPGQSVTLTLADEVDASRGSVIAAERAPPAVTTKAVTRLFWIGREPARAGNEYLARIGPQLASATIDAVSSRIDFASAEPELTEAVMANDLGDVELSFDRLVTADAFARNRDTGSLILIDRSTFDTVAMGLVLTPREQQGHVKLQASGSWLSSPNRWLPDSFADRRRSALKTATWRAAGTVLTVAAAFALTGDLGIALLLGAFELVVKFALQFGHERLWTRIGIGLRLRPVSTAIPPAAT